MKVLLSIKPEYSKKIFSGDKKYEFRKQTPKARIETVFVYESYPSKIIIGKFTVNRVISGSPKEIWERCKFQGGIEKGKFFNYCNGKKIIYALEIDNIFPFKPPIDPYKMDTMFKPPQNFSYINNVSFSKALEDWGE